MVNTVFEIRIFSNRFHDYFSTVTLLLVIISKLNFFRQKLNDNIYVKYTVEVSIGFRRQATVKIPFHTNSCKLHFAFGLCSSGPVVVLVTMELNLIRQVKTIWAPQGLNVQAKGLFARMLTAEYIGNWKLLTSRPLNCIYFIHRKS